VKRDPARRRLPLGDEQAAEAWLDYAHRRLFPVTAERDERGEWTATHPRGRVSLQTRRDLEELRAEARRDGAHPGDVVMLAREMMRERGMTHLLEIIDRESP
jgi:hypothetical protein